MKITKIILTTALLLALASCAVVEGKESAKQYARDASITRKVKNSIFDDPALSAHEIHVETVDGEVQLSGFVNTYKETVLAEEKASNVAGVRAVHNNLMVRRVGVEYGKGKESMKEIAQDAEITSKIKLLLIGDPELSSYKIKVSTHKSIVELSGVVGSHAEALKAEDIAKDVKGVRKVKNQIKIQKIMN